MNILYLGHNNAVTSALEGLSPSILMVDNPIRLLKMRTALSKIDLIVADKDLKGVNMYRLQSVLLKDGAPKNAAIVVFGEAFTKEERKAYLQSGISEIASSIAQLKIVLAFVSTKSKLETTKSSSAPKSMRWSKRAFDICFALFFLLLTAPLLLFIVIAIRLESQGSVVYRSKRVGQGYKVFDFFKFRTMRKNADTLVKNMGDLNQYVNEVPSDILRTGKTNRNEILIDALGNPIDEETFINQKKADKLGTFFKVQNDPRITKVGRFLRSTSLDELPQFINVLLGDMSVIGNRPLPLYEAEQLTTDEWVARFMAPAGITGLWQVEKRGQAGMSETERKELDNFYAKNSSFLLDIKILLRTLPALFQKENV